MKTPFHIMLIPTLGCPSRCSYCWSSEEGSPVMSIETVKETVAWLKNFRIDPVTITFHGGEPLLAGAEFYRLALRLISEELSQIKPSFAMQTNLWQMTPETADILAAYNVPLGSSIDGPREINDLQRGNGYFDKTMNGYRIAREHGVEVRFICTFTRTSVASREEIFDFFHRNGFIMKLHPALPSLRNKESGKWALNPHKYGELLVFLLDKSLEHIDDMDIMNINDLVRCVFTRRGNVCTFADCMGNTFAIGPDGNIYPCYRFVGMDEFVMGHVSAHPTAEDLAQSEAGKLMQEYKEFVDRKCGDCTHIRYCRGGCPYNAIAPTNGRITGVDPHCVAYKRIFDEICDRLDREMFESPSIERSVFQAGPQKKGRSSILLLMNKIVLR
jgi:uncharacterized protein